MMTILIILHGWFGNDFGKAVDELSELIKVGVLTVVTFVLGRYFRSSR